MCVYVCMSIYKVEVEDARWSDIKRVAEDLKKNIYSMSLRNCLYLFSYY